MSTIKIPTGSTVIKINHDGVVSFFKPIDHSIYNEDGSSVNFNSMIWNFRDQNWEYSMVKISLI